MAPQGRQVCVWLVGELRRGKQQSEGPCISWLAQGAEARRASEPHQPLFCAQAAAYRVDGASTGCICAHVPSCVLTQRVDVQVERKEHDQLVWDAIVLLLLGACGGTKVWQ
jgi:hypothetical protein